jgi:phosphonate transport system substrate-binding protein
MMRTIGAAAIAVGMLALLPATATAQQAAACGFRGSLDEAYCDENRDMVADAPADPARLRDPSTLVFAVHAVEDPRSTPASSGPSWTTSRSAPASAWSTSR